MKYYLNPAKKLICSICNLKKTRYTVIFNFDIGNIRKKILTKIINLDKFIIVILLWYMNLIVCDTLHCHQSRCRNYTAAARMTHEWGLQSYQEIGDDATTFIPVHLSWGFILSTGDQCGRDTPDENIFEMINSARIHGKYWPNPLKT